MDPWDALQRAILDGRQHQEDAPLTSLRAIAGLSGPTAEPARVEVVRRARAAGLSWAAIGRELTPEGVSRQAAQKRYGPLIGEQESTP